MTETTNTQPTATKTKTKRTGALSIVAVLTFGLIAAPLLSSSASASLDSGAFCIQAVSEEEKYKGKKGGCDLEAPEVPTPAVPTPPVETTPAAPPVIDEPEEAAMESRRISAVFTIVQGHGYGAYAPYKLTITDRLTKEVAGFHEGTTSMTGYKNHNNALWINYEARQDDPIEFRDYDVELVIGGAIFTGEYSASNGQSYRYDPHNRTYLDYHNMTLTKNGLIWHKSGANVLWDGSVR